MVPLDLILQRIDCFVLFTLLLTFFVTFCSDFFVWDSDHLAPIWFGINDAEGRGAFSLAGIRVQVYRILILIFTWIFFGGVWCMDPVFFVIFITNSETPRVLDPGRYFLTPTLDEKPDPDPIPSRSYYNQGCESGLIILPGYRSDLLETPDPDPTVGIGLIFSI